LQSLISTPLTAQQAHQLYKKSGGASGLFAKASEHSQTLEKALVAAQTPQDLILYANYIGHICKQVRMHSIHFGSRLSTHKQAIEDRLCSF